MIAPKRLDDIVRQLLDAADDPTETAEIHAWVDAHGASAAEYWNAATKRVALITSFPTGTRVVVYSALVGALAPGVVQDVVPTGCDAPYAIVQLDHSRVTRCVPLEDLLRATHGGAR